MFEIIGLLVLLPFVAAWSYFGKMRTLDPHSAALIKSSHGAGMVALGAWVLAALSAPIRSFDVGAGLSPGALLWVPVAVAGFGFYWLVTGWRKARRLGEHPGDEFLVVRSVVKVAVGIAGFVLLSSGYRFLDRDVWALVLDVQWLIRAAAIWCVVTGAARFVLLLAVKRRPRSAPQAAPFTRGHADDADRDNALRALRGSGGNRSFDDMDF